MPRFFFDIDWEGLILADDEGLEFPTALAAREEAARAVAEMVSDGLVDDAADARLLVRSENGDALFEVKLASEAGPERRPDR
jgi:hypothetical protein